MTAVRDVCKLWQAAQTAEANFWAGYRNRPELVLENLAAMAAFFRIIQPFLEASGARRILEVGIGGLGIGCVAPFVSTDLLVAAVDPLRPIAFALDDPALCAYLRVLRNRIAFQQAAAEKLPFEGGAFQAVACTNVLDHCLSPDRVLQEIWRVLGPGGYLFLSVHTFSALGRARFECCRWLRPDSNHVFHPHSFTHAMLEGQLRGMKWQLTRRFAPGFMRRWLGKWFSSIWICQKPPSSGDRVPGMHAASSKCLPAVQAVLTQGAGHARAVTRTPQAVAWA